MKTNILSSLFQAFYRRWHSGRSDSLLSLPSPPLPPSPEAITRCWGATPDLPFESFLHMHMSVNGNRAQSTRWYFKYVHKMVFHTNLKLAAFTELGHEIWTNRHMEAARGSRAMDPSLPIHPPVHSPNWQTLSGWHNSSTANTEHWNQTSNFISRRTWAGDRAEPSPMSVSPSQRCWHLELDGSLFWGQGTVPEWQGA